MKKSEMLKALAPFDDDADIFIELDGDDELIPIDEVSAAPDVDEETMNLVNSKTLCIIRA